ncbi:hypothetical protein ACW4YW_15115 [Methylobacillus pratensis]
MFDTYVAGRLKVWADWRIRRDQGGVGYPRKVAFLKVAPTPAGFWTPEMDSQAYEMEQCVMALDEVLYDAVVACYLHTTSLDQKLIFCGCKKDTYYRRINQAHKVVLGFMNDLAAGMTLKTIPKLRKPKNILRAIA